jgi:hypothetical protein
VAWLVVVVLMRPDEKFQGQEKSVMFSVRKKKKRCTGLRKSKKI